MKYTIFNTPVLKSVLHWVSVFMLRIIGWKTVGAPPPYPKYVVILAFHTCALDMFYGLLLAFALRLDAHFMAKQELFKRPWGPVMKWLGALPIDRSRSANVVEEMISVFASHDRYILGITPEGTRKKTDSWKTGFYYIANGARVPIILAFIDYPSKSGGLGQLVRPSGNIDKDMRLIRSFYSCVRGRHPERIGPVTIRARKKAS